MSKLTGEEICALAEKHTEDLEIDRNIGLTLINECIILDLGKDAGVIGKQTVSAVENEWVSLTEPFLEIFEIEKEGSATPYYGRQYGKIYKGIFDLRENMIRFPESGIFTIYGYVMPPVLRDINAKPAVHPILHYAIALYVASRAVFMDDEENPNAAALWQQYNYYKQKALEHLEAIKPTTRATRFVKTNPFL